MALAAQAAAHCGAVMPRVFGGMVSVLTIGQTCPAQCPHNRLQSRTMGATVPGKSLGPCTGRSSVWVQRLLRCGRMGRRENYGTIMGQTDGEPTLTKLPAVTVDAAVAFLAQAAGAAAAAAAAAAAG